MSIERKLKNKFLCQKCGEKINFWQILKLSFQQEQIKKYNCKCGNKIKFKENQILRYLPALIAGTIVFFVGMDWRVYILYGFIVLVSFWIYFSYFVRIDN